MAGLAIGALATRLVTGRRPSVEQAPPAIVEVPAPAAQEPAAAEAAPVTEPAQPAEPEAAPEPEPRAEEPATAGDKPAEDSESLGAGVDVVAELERRYKGRRAESEQDRPGGRRGQR